MTSRLITSRPPSPRRAADACRASRGGRQFRGFRRRGFTLVELVIVAAIVVVLASIAAPRYANSQHRYQADAAARRLAGDLQLAQTAARSAAADRTVTFDLAAATLTIQGLTPLHGGTGDYQSRFASEPYRAAFTSADFGGDAILIFNGYGQPDSGGTVTLRSGGHLRQVTVNAATGEAVTD